MPGVMRRARRRGIVLRLGPDGAPRLEKVPNDALIAYMVIGMGIVSNGSFVLVRRDGRTSIYRHHGRREGELRIRLEEARLAQLRESVKQAMPWVRSRPSWPRGHGPRGILAVKRRAAGFDLLHPPEEVLPLLDFLSELERSHDPLAG